MTIESHITQGFVISDIIKGYLVQRVYIGFSRKEAMQKFKREVYHENKN